MNKERIAAATLSTMDIPNNKNKNSKGDRLQRYCQPLISDSLPSLPQPDAPDLKYTYTGSDKFTSSLQSQLKTFPPETPVRLMLSKGKNRAAQLSPHTVVLEENEEDGNEADDRLTVRYAKGSTYKVRTKHILPITKENNLIIVVPETVDYRRLCIVQTPQDHSFIEIGCDFALTVGNVHCCKRLGIDKSPSSLEIAKSNFPTLALEEIDILLENQESLMQLLKRYEMDDTSKLIVGIDINGNRALNAVVDCLKRVLDIWQPRLVIVKSRSLFQQVV